jgi:hypothetical protein
VEWCQRQQEQETDWERVVFSDESWFELGVDRQWVWRHVNERTPDVCAVRTTHPPKVMIWGAIGYDFKSSLHIVQGRINGDYYLHNILCGTFLAEAVRPYGFQQDGRAAWVLQQDNARPHVRADVI